MSEKPKRKRQKYFSLKRETVVLVILVLGLFAAAIACYGIPNLILYDEFFPRRITQEIAGEDARNFVAAELSFELPENAQDIHFVWSRKGQSNISFTAKMSFKATPDEMLNWLDEIFQCELDYSFEDSYVRPHYFEWDDAPDWWRYESASNVILGWACSLGQGTFYHHTFLVDRDDAQIWTIYMTISVP